MKRRKREGNCFEVALHTCLKKGKAYVRQT
jgi:hypothetical protein